MPNTPDDLARRARSQWAEPATRAVMMERRRETLRLRREAIEAAGIKPCRRCGRVLPLAEFNRRSKHGRSEVLRPWCRACDTAATAGYYRAHPEWSKQVKALYAERHRLAIRLRGWLRAIAGWGHDPDRYRAWLEAHPGTCDLCGRTPAGSPGLALDHCHATNAVRGLLCASCNNGLGRFGDDPARLRAAASYLERAPDLGRMAYCPTRVPGTTLASASTEETNEMRCENCRGRITGQPSHVGLARAAGNGFYKGSRPVAVCAACAEEIAELNAASAFRAEVENASGLWRAMRLAGSLTDEAIEAIYAGVHGPAVVAAIKAEVSPAQEVAEVVDQGIARCAECGAAVTRVRDDEGNHFCSAAHRASFWAAPTVYRLQVHQPYPDAWVELNGGEVYGSWAEAWAGLREATIAARFHGYQYRIAVA